jgi:hypothetical protein
MNCTAAANTNVFAGSQAKTEKEEDCNCNPEHRIAQLIAQFKSRDAKQHIRSPP